MEIIIKIRYELDGHILQNGDKVYVEYNPFDNIFFKMSMNYQDGVLFSDDHTLKIDLSSYDVLCIDTIKLLSTHIND